VRHKGSLTPQKLHNEWNGHLLLLGQLLHLEHVTAEQSREPEDKRVFFFAGLPDFSWYNIPKREKIPNSHKIYQSATKYTKVQQNIPKCNKIYQSATKYTKLQYVQ
jgi:hypothetical protein